MGILFLNFCTISMIVYDVLCLCCLPFQMQHIQTRHRKDIVIMWKCTQHYVEIHRKLTGNVTSQAHKQESL